jgi:ATP-dependent RNA helicase DDX5/DBP2
VHRIGRTGRAGAVGTAYTFFTPSNYKLAHELVAILSEAGQEVPPQLAAIRGSMIPTLLLIFIFSNMLM